MRIEPYGLLLIDERPRWVGRHWKWGIALLLLLGMGIVGLVLMVKTASGPSIPAGAPVQTPGIRVEQAAEHKGTFPMTEAMRRDVERLATSEGRLVGSPGHAAARAFIIGRLEKLGLQGYGGAPFEFPYSVGGDDFVNVLAELPGSSPELPPILLVAHYDTCGARPGADDNAAAIAILLAAVEPLRELRLDRTVVFAFFDAEEPPHFLDDAMGSVYFYRHQRKGPIHCPIVLDLCGHDIPIVGLEDVMFVVGVESDEDLAAVVRNCEPSSGIRTIPTLNRYVGDMSDHYVFRVNRRPYLFLSCGRWGHYHQATDTPEKLNYVKMAGVADYVVSVCAELCKHDLAGPFEGYDSTDTELYFLTRTAGPLMEQLGIRARSREDIDALAEIVLAQFRL